MKLSQLLTQGRVTVSCELFPPKTGAALAKVEDVLRDTAALAPDFISVTYGAGGSTSKRTLELAARLHVTRQAVSNWERNRNLPELEILLSAAELLGVGVDELLYGPRPAEGVAAPANRRRRTVTAGALWAAWAALWLAYQLWALPALEAMYDKYDYSAAGWLLLWPALNLLLGMAVCALVSIWRELRPRRLALRRALFWAGAGCAALLLLGVLLLPVHGALVALHESAIPYLLCGGLIFCGWGRKAG